VPTSKGSNPVRAIEQVDFVKDETTKNKPKSNKPGFKEPALAIPVAEITGRSISGETGSIKSETRRDKTMPTSDVTTFVNDVIDATDPSFLDEDNGKMKMAKAKFENVSSNLSNREGMPLGGIGEASQLKNTSDDNFSREIFKKEVPESSCSFEKTLSILDEFLAEPRKIFDLSSPQQSAAEKRFRDSFSIFENLPKLKKPKLDDEIELTSLPTDVLVKIFNFLPSVDLLNVVVRVCKLFHEVSKIPDITLSIRIGRGNFLQQTVWIHIGPIQIGKIHSNCLSIGKLVKLN